MQLRGCCPAKAEDATNQREGQLLVTSAGTQTYLAAVSSHFATISVALRLVLHTEGTYGFLNGPSRTMWPGCAECPHDQFNFARHLGADRQEVFMITSSSCDMFAKQSGQNPACRNLESVLPCQTKLPRDEGTPNNCGARSDGHHASSHSQASK